MAETDPYRLFLQAESFHAASRKLLPPPDASPEQLAPYIANSVFALELYLKCLLMLVKGKYPRLHSVQALFYDLPEAEIARVRKLHRHIYRAHFVGGRDGDQAADARLEAIVTGAKDAFYTARYAYERSVPTERGIPDVTVVTTAVRGRISELEPAWRSI